MKGAVPVRARIGGRLGGWRQGAIPCAEVTGRLTARARADRRPRNARVTAWEGGFARRWSFVPGLRAARSAGNAGPVEAVTPASRASSSACDDPAQRGPGAQQARHGRWRSGGRRRQSHSACRSAGMPIARSNRRRQRPRTRSHHRSQTTMKQTDPRPQVGPESAVSSRHDAALINVQGAFPHPIC